MWGPSREEKSARLYELHKGPQILVLPNVWDVASARVFEEAGFAAIATTSAGMSNSLGFPDGQHAPWQDVLNVVWHIAISTAVPLSVDIEAGYDDDAGGNAMNCALGLLAAGAVGVNLEDSNGDVNGILVEVGLQIEKIRSLRKAEGIAGVPLLINARTDAFHLANLDDAAKFALAVERANAYREAGADCIFTPFVTDATTIAGLVKEIDGPLNVLAMPGTPPVAELEQMGVRRVSVGSGPFRSTLALIKRIARDLRENGTYNSFMDDAMPSAEANALFLENI